MNEVQVVQYLLEAGADPNLGATASSEEGQGGMTPLMAASFHHPESPLVEMLLKYGADPKVFRDIDGLNALHLAAKAGSVKNVKLLLYKEGMDPNVKSLQHGQSPAHLAVIDGRLEVNSTRRLVLLRAMRDFGKFSIPRL